MAPVKKKPDPPPAPDGKENRRGNRGKFVIQIGVRVGARPLTTGRRLNVDEGGGRRLCSGGLRRGGGARRAPGGAA